MTSLSATRKAIRLASLPERLRGCPRDTLSLARHRLAMRRATWLKGVDRARDAVA